MLETYLGEHVANVDRFGVHAAHTGEIQKVDFMCSFKRLGILNAFWHGACSNHEAVG